MTAVGHVALSVLLGFAIVAMGLLFSQEVTLYINEGTGLIMIVGGVAYGFRELRPVNEEDYETEVEGKLARGAGTLGKSFSYFAVLGAALSPDLSILPVFLLAVPLGLSLALGPRLSLELPPSSPSSILCFWEQLVLPRRSRGFLQNTITR